jgi:hypothetical protein
LALKPLIKVVKDRTNHQWHSHHINKLLYVSKSEKLTGRATAASRTGLTPTSGDCKRDTSLKTMKARLDRYGGTSRMMLIFKTPGSTALQNQTKLYLT